MSEGQFDINDLDDLSRKAANGHTLPFKEEAWEKMEALLDKEDKKRRAIFWWWLVPAVLLLGSGGIYWATRNSTPKVGTATGTTVENNGAAQQNKPAATPSAPVNTSPSSAPAQKTSNINSLAKQPGKKQTANFNNLIKPDRPVEETSSGTNNWPAVATAGQNKKGRLNVQPTTEKNGGAASTDQSKYPFEKDKAKFTTLDKNQGQTNTWPLGTNSGNNPDQPTNKTADMGEPVAKLGSAGGNLQNNLGNNTAQPMIGAARPTNDQASLLKKLDSNKISSATHDSVQKTALDQPTDSNATAAKKAAKSLPSKSSKFEFSALAEADLSMVKFKRVNQLSSGFGIGVSYRLGNRFSIGTGIAYGTKLYRADSTDYNKAALWNMTVLGINANCKVLEIPLDVSFLVSQQKRSSWFATVGLSSYIMKQESYTYAILKNGMVKKMTYVYKNEYNHIMSILTLQADYQRKINDQFSWQLSPFVKLPLTGIGEGAVSLESVGLQFSLHYRPKKK